MALRIQTKIFIIKQSFNIIFSCVGFAMSSPLHNFSLRELQNLQDYNNRALAHLEDITIWFWRENSRTFMRRIQIEDEMQFTIPGS